MKVRNRRSNDSKSTRNAIGHVHQQKTNLTVSDNGELVDDDCVSYGKAKEIPAALEKRYAKIKQRGHYKKPEESLSRTKGARKNSAAMDTPGNTRPTLSESPAQSHYLARDIRGYNHQTESSPAFSSPTI